MEKKKAKPRKKKEYTPEEQKVIDERKELFDFVFFDIMGYVEGMKMGKTLALRLEGLHNGVFMGNKNSKPRANYPYKVIYFTFVLMKKEIQYRLSTMDFKDENHRFNYVMVIIESKINDVVMALLKNKKTTEALERQTPAVVLVEPIHQFVKAEEPKSAKLFDDDMW